MKRIMFLGIPASLEMSVRALGMTTFTFLVATFGTLAIAVNGIGTNILSFVFIPTIGLSMATAALVGQNIGAGYTERAEKISILAAKVGFVSLAVLGVLIFVWARPIVTFFVPGNEDVIAEGARFLRIYALTFGFMGAQQTLLGTFRGAGNVVASMMIAIVTMWVVQLPAAYVLSHYTPLSLDGLWWSFAILNVVSFVITVYWFNRGGWKKIRLTTDQQLAADTAEEAIIEEGLRH
jgi:Na+-driven multidrug efflux pump